MERGADINAQNAVSERMCLIGKGDRVCTFDGDKLAYIGCCYTCSWVFVALKPLRQSGLTALMVAAERGHTAVVENLLEQGVDTNAQNEVSG